MPEKMVKDLNTYLDELLKQDDRESLAGTLVGQIHRGEQLNMDPEHELLQEYCQFVTGLGASYVNAVMENTGHALEKPRQIAVDEVWSVHSFEGDYNPIHDHGTKTIMGISTTGWTKVPQQILDQPTAGSPQYSKYNSSGACDGYLAFSYGRNQIMDVERLTTSTECRSTTAGGKAIGVSRHGYSTWFILSSGKVNAEQWHRT